jgi:hypothetical protein
MPFSIIAWAISCLVRAGVPGRFVRATLMAGMVTALVIGLGVAKCSYDRAIISHHVAKLVAASNAVQAANDNALLNAANARQADTAVITTQEKERNNAISQATNTRPSRAECLLNRERLRQAGYHEASIPKCQ